MPIHCFRSLLAALAAALIAPVPARAAEPAAAPAVEPATVYFPSADGRTPLVGYLFAPSQPGVHPAVVMLHGRGGPYSIKVNGDCTLVAAGQPSPCNASGLTLRHRMWGEYWAEHGYFALMVDSFGPRGRAHGYGRHSHEDPARDAVNERTVRPLDAEGALAWLAARPDVRPNRILLQGWSNGASTALNTMYRQALATTPGPGFRAALVLYPGCGPASLISQRYEARSPVWVYLGSADEEVSPRTCSRVLGQADGGQIKVTVFDGATHDFDDPGTARQAVAANRSAKEEVMQRAFTQFDTLP